MAGVAQELKAGARVWFEGALWRVRSDLRILDCVPIEASYDLGMSYDGTWRWAPIERLLPVATPWRTKTLPGGAVTFDRRLPRVDESVVREASIAGCQRFLDEHPDLDGRALYEFAMGFGDHVVHA